MSCCSVFLYVRSRKLQSYYDVTGCMCSPIMSQSSSICKAAIHAGAIGVDGGYVDILPLDKRKSYVGVLKNGIQSDRYPFLFVARIHFIV